MVQETHMCSGSKKNRELILRESHDFAYSIHPLSTLHHDLKSRYWWYEMKRVIAEYVALCDNCQRVKAECQRHGLLQWKWEKISMDFIVGLPITQSGYDSIWVIVDPFQRLPISYRSRLRIREQSLQSYMLPESCVYTECPRR
jgi:hypothetical protein